MTTFSVALLQLLPGRSQEKTLQKGLACCRQAKALGADLTQELHMAIAVTYLERFQPLPHGAQPPGPAACPGL